VQAEGEEVNITDLLTDKQQKQGFPLLRAEVGRVLNPGPWEHRRCLQGQVNKDDPLGSCAKCGMSAQRCTMLTECKYPDPWGQPLEVAAERLLELILPTDLIPAIVEYKQIGLIEETAKKALAYECYILMDPAERCAVLIEALSGKEGDTEDTEIDNDAS
jgi:hypothetical protein